MTAYLRISRLKISNFCGIKELDISLEGKPGAVLVNGKSGSCKSTIIDGIRWALVGMTKEDEDIEPFTTMEGFEEWSEQSVEVTFKRTVKGLDADQEIIVKRVSKRGSKESIVSLSENGTISQAFEETRKKINSITKARLISSDGSYRNAGTKEDRVWWVQGDELMRSMLKMFAKEEDYDYYVSKTGANYCLSKLDEHADSLRKKIQKTGGFTTRDKEKLDKLANDFSDLEEAYNQAKDDLDGAKSELEEFEGKPENENLNKGDNVRELQKAKLDGKRLERDIEAARLDRDEFKEFLFTTALQMLINEGMIDDESPDGVAKKERSAASVLLQSSEKANWPKVMVDTLNSLKERTGLSIGSLVRQHNIADIGEFHDQSEKLTSACTAKDEFSPNSSEQITEYIELKRQVDDARQNFKNAKDERDTNQSSQSDLMAKQEKSEEAINLGRLRQITLNLSKQIKSAIEQACENHSIERIEVSNEAIDAMGLGLKIRFSNEQETKDAGSRHFRDAKSGAKIGDGRSGALAAGQSAVCFAGLLAGEFQSNKVLLPLFLDDAITGADHGQILSVSEGLNKWSKQLGCQVWICSNSVRDIDYDTIDKTVCTSHIAALTTDHKNKHGVVSRKIRTQDDFEVENYE